jgi:hypothetical protein
LPQKFELFGICHNPAFIEYIPSKFLIFLHILQIDGMDFGSRRVGFQPIFGAGLGRPRGPMEAYGWARVTLPCTPSQAPGAKDMPRMRLGLVGGGISTPLSGRNPNLW